MASFRIRPASLAAGDDQRLLDMFDSQLPWLASKGSSEQWGAEPPTGEKRVKQLQKCHKSVMKSQTSVNEPWTKDSCRIYVAEAKRTSPAEGQEDHVPVAMMILTGEPSDYVQPNFPSEDPQEPFVFLSWLITDRRLGALANGAGVFLLDFAKEQVASIGMKRLCCDCWSGNGRVLVKFYERLGFHAIGEFVDEGWPGTILDMRL